MNIFGFEMPTEYVILVLIGIIAFVIIKFYKNRSKTYPRKDIDEEVPREFEDMIKTSGTKVFKEKILLYDGFIKLGRITSMTPLHFDSELSVKLNMKKNKNLEKLKAQVKNDESFIDNFYLFEVVKDNIISKLLYLIGKGKKYHLVEQKALTVGYRQYSISIYQQPIHYFKNIYIYSKQAKAVALNIADRLIIKQTLNGVINYIPKMEFVEMKTANYVAKVREFTDIKDKSWKKREENLEKEIE